MQPARMQVQLHVLSCLGYPSRDIPHRLVTEVGRLQSFDEEGSAGPEFGEIIKQETDAMLLSVNLPENHGLADRKKFRIVEITTDAELGIDGNAYLGALWCFHGLSINIGLEGPEQTVLSRASGRAARRSSASARGSSR